MDFLPSSSSSGATKGTDPVRPMPGHAIINSVKLLTEDQKRALGDIIFKAKSMHSQFQECGPTSKETAYFLASIFRYWKSGEYHQLPDPMSLSSGMKDKTVEVGVLLEDYPSEKEIREEQKRRGHTSKALKNRAYKHLARELDVKTTAKERMRGATVSMRAMVTRHNQVNLQLLTSNGNFLSPYVTMSWFNHLNETTAHYMAMKAHDLFELSRVNRYNLEVAVFIARNRVTHWANGHHIHSRPDNEPFKLFIPIRTVRYNVQNSAGDTGTQKSVRSLSMLEDMEPYRLYEFIPVDEAEDAEEAKAEPVDQVCDA